MACALVLGVLASLLAPATWSQAAIEGRIVYSDAYGGSGIYTIAPDGSDRIHLVDEADVYRPRWIPDGSGVSFTAPAGARGRHYRLEAVDIDGGNRRVIVGLKELPDGFDHVGSYAWAPDATQLVLNLFGDGSALFVSSADGTSMTKIAGNAYSPEWSSLDRIVAVRNGHLITMDPDGGNVVKLSLGTDSADPSWSPDGGTIGFMCGRFAHADICVVNADGTGLVNLTDSRNVDWSPAWSPDGSRIVWSRSREVSSFADLMRIRADGGGTTRLTSTRRIDEYEPDWAVLT
jgi:Tol biopolymer transport system component